MKKFKDLKLGDVVYDCTGSGIWRNTIIKITIDKYSVEFVTKDNTDSTFIFNVPNFFINSNIYLNGWHVYTTDLKRIITYLNENFWRS